MSALFCLLFLLPVCAQQQTSMTYEVVGRPKVERPVRVINDRKGKAEADSTLRVCTYNIENFTDGMMDDGRRTGLTARRQARKAGALLSEISADVVFIQEIENAIALKLLNQYIKPRYPVGYITRFGGANARDQKLNIAVLSRVPLEHVRELDFGYCDGPGRPPRGALAAVLALAGNRKLLCYGVHLKSNWGERPQNVARRQNGLRFVRADVDLLTNKYARLDWEVMICGDMNVDPDNESFRDDLSLEPVSDWHDLWRGQPIGQRTTIPTRYGDPNRTFPPAAFDRFVVSGALMLEPWKARIPGVLRKGVNTRNVQAVAGRDPEHVSDHYPVYLDLVR
jgi:endonuclease/exonuclease/phosphatase family metal-dependent hydrolase